MVVANRDEADCGGQEQNHWQVEEGVAAGRYASSIAATAGCVVQRGYNYYYLRRGSPQRPRCRPTGAGSGPNFPPTATSLCAAASAAARLTSSARAKWVLRPTHSKTQRMCASSANTSRPSAVRSRQQRLHGVKRQGPLLPSLGSPVPSTGRPRTACPRALSALPTPPRATPSETAPWHSTPRPWPSATTSPTPAQ